MSDRIATASELLDMYAEEWSTEMHPATRRRYRYELGRWARLTGDPPINEIDTQTYQRFRAATIEAGLKPATCESALRVVRSILRMAMAHGLIDRAPDRGRARRISAPQPQPPSPAEVDEFLKAAHYETRWPRLHVRPRVFWYSVVCVGCWTGLRRWDLLWGLQWRHVDLENHVIRYSASKTDHEHAWPLTPLVERHIEAMRPTFGTDPERLVFGPGLSPHLLQQTMERLCLAAEIRRLTFKMFRQYAVSQWTAANEAAGQLLHGCGLPRVLRHYIDPLVVLSKCADAVVMPSELSK